MKKTITSMVSGIMLLGLGSAQADDGGLGLGLAVNTGTLGHGIQIGKSLTDSFNVRLGMNSISQSDSQNIDGIDYKTDLDLSNNSLLLDWHPFEGTFHLSLGYVNSGNELRAVATPTNVSVAIGDTTYSAGDIGQLNAKVEFGSGPYLGLGWGNVPASGFGFSFELGAIQSGAPVASLVASNLDPAVFNTQAKIDQLNAEILKEEKNIQKDLDEYELYPVIALGISYGF